MVYINIFTLFISINLLIQTTPQDNSTTSDSNYPCNAISECFSCVASSVCNWNSNSCVKGTHSQFHLMFTSNQPCTDSHSISIKEKYCGSEKLLFQNNKIEITLPNILNNYGKQDLFCTFELDLQNKSTNMNGEIQINKNYFMSLILQIEVGFTDGSEERIIDSTLMGVKIKKGKSIKFYYYQLQEFQDLPFRIILKKEKSSISVSMILTIVLIVLLLILCGMGIYLFRKKYIRRKLIQAMMQRRIRDQVESNQEHQNEEQIQKEKEERLAMIEIFIKNNLHSMKFNSDLGKISSNCTICLDEYTSQSDVVKTECGHVFHFKCIKNWLHTNIMNAKCPNCNYFFIEEDRLKNKLKEEEGNINQNNNQQHISAGNMQIRVEGNVNSNISNENQHIQQRSENIQNQSRIDNSNNHLIGNNSINNNYTNEYVSRLNKKKKKDNVQQLNNIQQQESNVGQECNDNNVNAVNAESVPVINENNKKVKVNKNLEVLHIYENANSQDKK